MMSFRNFVSNNSPKVTMEGIAYQRDDWFVKNLVANVQGIYDSYNEGRATDIDNYVLDIESDILRRFGIRTKLITNKSDLLVELFGFDTDSGLVEMKKLINQINMRQERLKERGRNVSRLEQGILKNGKILNAWVATNVLKVDEDKATIEGLPTEDTEFGKFSAYLHVNFENFVLGEYGKKDISGQPDKPTPEELAAGILHEIGHMFGFVSYAYKTRNSYIIFEDTLRDQVRKGESDKRAFLLAYKEAYEKDLNIKKYEDVKLEKVLIAKFKDLANGSFKTDKNAYLGYKGGTINNELHADQFCNRFGMGKELSSFLLKFSVWEANVTTSIKRTFMAMIAVYLVLCLILEMFAVAIIGGFIVFGYGMFVSALTDTMQNIFRLKVGSKYDTPYKRVERMYLDIIRNIRMNIDNASLRSELVSNAIGIKGILDEMISLGMTSEGYETTIFNKVVEFFNDDIKNSRLMALVDNDLEKVMENDLYLSYGMIGE